MALWLVRVDAGQDQVTLTYFEEGAPPKDCGRGPLALLSEVEAFAGDQATPWDRVQVNETVFVRQVPAGMAV